MSGQPPSKVYFPLLDALRGPAALLVFLEHWRNLFFQDFSSLKDPGLALKVFYVFTGAGREAVLVFFVLSGCVIAHVIYTTHARGKWSWSSYLSARLTRLWVVLIPALALTVLWDQLGMVLGGRIYEGTGFGNILNSPVLESSGAWVFIGNIFFVQEILVPTFGSNGPLWSISYEFIYYLVYPAFLVCFAATHCSWLVRSASLVMAVGLLVLSGWAISGAFLIWLAGVGAYWLFLCRALPPRESMWGFGLGLIGVLACIAGSRSGYPLPLIDWSWLIAATCAFAVYCGLAVSPTASMMRLLQPLHGLSAISYSLYLLHTPLLVFLASRYFSDNAERWQPDAAKLAYGLAIAILVFVYSLLVWFVSEHQTGRVRRWLSAVNLAIAKP